MPLIYPEIYPEKIQSERSRCIMVLDPMKIISQCIKMLTHCFLFLI